MEFRLEADRYSWMCVYIRVYTEMWTRIRRDKRAAFFFFLIHWKLHVLVITVFLWSGHSERSPKMQYPQEHLRDFFFFKERAKRMWLTFITHFYLSNWVNDLGLFPILNPFSKDDAPSSLRITRGTCQAPKSILTEVFTERFYLDSTVVISKSLTKQGEMKHLDLLDIKKRNSTYNLRATSHVYALTIYTGLFFKMHVFRYL